MSFGEPRFPTDGNSMAPQPGAPAAKAIRAGKESRSPVVAHSQEGDVFGLQTLSTLSHRKLNGLSFFECAIAVRLDRREMDEYIFARLPLDESVSLGGVEPLYSTLFFH